MLASLSIQCHLMASPFSEDKKLPVALGSVKGNSPQDMRADFVKRGIEYLAQYEINRLEFALRLQEAASSGTLARQALSDVISDGRRNASYVEADLIILRTFDYFRSQENGRVKLGRMILSDTELKASFERMQAARLGLLLHFSENALRDPELAKAIYGEVYDERFLAAFEVAVKLLYKNPLVFELMTYVDAEVARNLLEHLYRGDTVAVKNLRTLAGERLDPERANFIAHGNIVPTVPGFSGEKHTVLIPGYAPTANLALGKSPVTTPTPEAGEAALPKTPAPAVQLPTLPGVVRLPPAGLGTITRGFFPKNIRVYSNPQALLSPPSGPSTVLVPLLPLATPGAAAAARGVVSSGWRWVSGVTVRAGTLSLGALAGGFALGFYLGFEGTASAGEGSETGSMCKANEPMSSEE